MTPSTCEHLLAHLPAPLADWLWWWIGMWETATALMADVWALTVGSTR